MPSSKKYNKSKGKARKNAAAAALVVKNSSGLSKILNHRLSPKQQRRASQMFAKMFKCTLESMEKLASAYDTLMFGNADEDDAFLEIHFLTMFLFLSNKLALMILDDVVGPISISGCGKMGRRTSITHLLDRVVGSVLTCH